MPCRAFSPDPAFSPQLLSPAAGHGRQRRKATPTASAVHHRGRHPTVLLASPPPASDDRRMYGRWGLTVPLTGVPLTAHATLLAELAAGGWTDAWSSEVAGIDASSQVIVRDWNAVPFVDPYGRCRDVLRFLRRALTGEAVDEAYPTFTIRRFRLERPPPSPPPIVLAALRSGMLRLAAAEADGVILNWLAVADLSRVRAELGAAKPGFETVARIFVCPTKDTAYARTVGRRLIATYLTVPAYAAFHRWLGRGDLLEPMWRAWAAGDRRGAASAVPDELVDALVLHGAPDECRAAVSRYVEGGVDTPVLALLPTPELERGGAKALRETLAALAPTSTVHSRE